MLFGAWHEASDLTIQVDTLRRGTFGCQDTAVHGKPSEFGELGEICGHAGDLAHLNFELPVAAKIIWEADLALLWPPG